VSERRRPISDPEILELFADEPELLAVTDAIAATLAPRRRRLPRRLLVAAAALGAGALLVALMPGLLGGRSLEDRALAAIGDARVVHVIATRAEPERTIVDLASGRVEPGVVTVESWFDSERGELRSVTRRDGTPVADVLVGMGPGEEGLDPVVTYFVRNYRNSLERGELDVLRRSRLGGADVLWVGLALRNDRRHEIALDADSDLPRAFRPAVGSSEESPLWRVQAIDSRLRADDNFTPSTPQRERPSQGRIASKRDVSTAEANRVLNGNARWPGPRVDGLELAQIQAQVLSRAFADGRRQRSAGVELLYGDLRRDYVRINEAEAPEPAYGFAEGRLTIDFAPIPDLGRLSLTRLGSLWLGQLSADSMHVTIRSPRRDLVVRAAGALAPIR
jgi:hypothetical protein